MKLKSKRSAIVPKDPYDIILKLESLAESDLEVPEIEETAIQLLRGLERKGYIFARDVGAGPCPCPICLFHRLISARDAVIDTHFEADSNPLDEFKSPVLH